jgi:hypothetical protein
MSSDAHSIEDVLLKGTSQVVANATAAVSKPFRMSSSDSMLFKCAVKASAVTAGGGISTFLQHSWDGGTTWATVDATAAGVAITTAATVQFTLNGYLAGDAAVTPVWPWCRIAVTAASDATCSIDNVWITRR